MRARAALAAAVVLVATVGCAVDPPVEDPVGFDRPSDAPPSTAPPSPRGPTPTAPTPTTRTTTDATPSSRGATPTEPAATTSPAPVPAAGTPTPAAPYGVVLTWNGIEIHLPSARTELVGMHQSNHDGARDLATVPDPPVPVAVLPSRDRGTGRRGAADIVVAPDTELRAPVTGRVVRAGTYTLYCDELDDFLVVEPDGHPGIEVKLLHIDGVQVAAGDRVVAQETVVAPRPTQLPFASQVDEVSGPDDWPHVHLEVVDTAIPDRPNENSGSDDC